MNLCSGDHASEGRRQIPFTYHVETEYGPVEKTLPFVVGVIGDFSGNPTEPLDSPKKRKFIELDQDNYDEIMAKMCAGLNLKVENTLKFDGSMIAIDLKFCCMRDFDPGVIIDQVEPLRKLLETRDKLKSLLDKVTKSEGLENVLSQLLQSDEDLRRMASDLGIPDDIEYENQYVENRISSSDPVFDNHDSYRHVVFESPHEEDSLLDQAIGLTKQTEPYVAEELLRNFTEQTISGTVTWDQNINRAFGGAVSAIDEKISEQLSVIIHSRDFVRLEAAWRGLRYLITSCNPNSSLKVKVLNISKRELFKDINRHDSFDGGVLFEQIYINETGALGGQPYGILIGDFEFSNHPEDIGSSRKSVGELLEFWEHGGEDFQSQVFLVA